MTAVEEVSSFLTSASKGFMRVIGCVLCTDRSETARLLLRFGADAGVQDSDGQLCVTAMITKMSPVVSIVNDRYGYSTS